MLEILCVSVKCTSEILFSKKLATSRQREKATKVMFSTRDICKESNLNFRQFTHSIYKKIEVWGTEKYINDF